jgi:hypothetical protein
MFPPPVLLLLLLNAFTDIVLTGALFELLLLLFLLFKEKTAIERFSSSFTFSGSTFWKALPLSKNLQSQKIEKTA